MYTLQKLSGKWYMNIDAQKESFNYCVEEDFNPDLVIAYGLDSFNCGLSRGIIIGIAASVIAGALIAGGKVIFDHLNKTKETS